MHQPATLTADGTLTHHPSGAILLQSSGGQFLLQSPIQIVQTVPPPSTSQQAASSSNLVHSGIKRPFDFNLRGNGVGSSSSAGLAPAVIAAAPAPPSQASLGGRNNGSIDFLSGTSLGGGGPPFFGDTKRRKEEKGGKGLRHFSMKVCEKVRAKGTTTYNEVADELVSEFAQDQQHAAANGDQVYDQKNIRRRVYDALNVLMAMNIISKEKKEIKWIGLPTNSVEEHQRLEQEKKSRIDRIAQKTRELHDLILYQIAYKNLVERNRKAERRNGPPSQSSAIPLPFVIVNTGKKTVIDCSISSDKTEYLFQFDNVFEINEEKDVLNMMGMTLGLEKPGQCTRANLAQAVSLVPKALEPYVVDIYNGVGRGEEADNTPIIQAPVPVASAINGNTGVYRVAAPSTSGMDLLHGAAVAVTNTNSNLSSLIGNNRNGIPRATPTSLSDEDEEEEEDYEFYEEIAS